MQETESIDIQAENFYPRPPRGGRLGEVSDTPWQQTISIHALREEGDRLMVLVFRAVTLFLSTPSARRATRVRLVCTCGTFRFLSTPSARRATLPSHAFSFSFLFLSTPSARRATFYLHYITLCFFCISIHALREEGDMVDRKSLLQMKYFYPRPPRGGRPAGMLCCSCVLDFYPRPPRGGRHPPLRFPSLAYIFLSTPSARRATQTTLFCGGRIWNFYPRPPRGGRLMLLQRRLRQASNFYPRPPRGGRREHDPHRQKVD